MKQLVLFVLLLSLFACSAQNVTNNENSVPVARQPYTGLADKLSPGLATHYLDGFYRHVRQMAPADKGRPGTPVLNLDHRFGEGEVFASGKSRGIGVEFSGYIHLSSSGVYQFQALSNDGVEVTIGGQRVAWDPTVHSDRLTAIEKLQVSSAGWYPVTVRYFQRKGTAALILYWQQPEETAMSVIPPAAFGH